MQTARGISAARASSMPAAANGGLSEGTSSDNFFVTLRFEAYLRHEDSSGRCTSLFHGLRHIGKDR